jgi:GNAT superfamily N-acetyltransferase
MSITTLPTVSEISDPKEIAAWTKAMYVSFVGTDNVLAETLFGLPPNVMPTESQLERAVEGHVKAVSTNPGDDGGRTSFIQVLDPATGAIMGGAKWVFFDDKPKLPEHVEVSWVTDPFEKEFAQATMNEFHSRRYKLMDTPQALLNILFTSPDYERRGVGSLMTKWGLERADQMRVPSFTEASLRGTPVYARLGFNTREDVRLRWDERGDQWKNKGTVAWTFMERPAKTSASQA